MVALARPRPGLVAALILAGTFVSPVHATLLFVGDATSSTIFTYSESTFVNQSGYPDMGLPGQIAAGPDGNIYVTDQNPSDGPAVDKFNGTTGQFIGQYVGASFSNGLSSPTGLAWGPDGKLYIADAGVGGFGFVDSFDGTTLATAIAPGVNGLGSPEGMTFDTSGNLYIADASTGTIFRWDGSTLISLTSVVDSGGAFEDVTFGPGGNLYVTDAVNSVVQVFAVDGSYLGHFGNTNSLVQPIGLAFGPDGNLYVSDAQGIEVFDNAGNFVTQLVQSQSAVDFPGNTQFLAFGNAVPEPATCIPVVAGLVGILSLRLRNKLRA